MEEEKKAQHEASRNARREGRILITVVVEIPRKKEVRVRQVTRKGEESDPKIWDQVGTTKATGLEA